jgi:pyrimidine-nucleoside phosphorylase
MIPAVVIAKKRDREALTREEIDFMVTGYARGEIPDYQMSALAMAIYIQGMDGREIADLTDIMIASGTCLKRVSDRPRVDKHSTGGLGDKTSLILAPLLACCDLDVPMISGRGLGITGGTLDKLEAIPGFRCNLTDEESESQLQEIGCFITGATDLLVPADKKLYALRDVTGTVPSIALITASIMSKKIAETLDALVLDVKCGSGAFLPTRDRAEALADSLISNGKRAGIATTSLITDMNQPLGEMVGNACEVDESIQVLENSGPEDVRELTLELCARLLVATGKSNDTSSARSTLLGHLSSGRAMERFERMVARQGGDMSAPRPIAKTVAWCAPKSGYLVSIDGQKLGQAIVVLGGGRAFAGQAIDFSVGLRMLARLGDSVKAGEELLHVYGDRQDHVTSAVELITQAIQIADEPNAAPLLWTEFVHRPR